MPDQYLDEAALRVLAARNRLQLVLVRCEGCRFVCPAQDAERLIMLVEREGAEHVRDVTIHRTLDSRM